MMSEEKDRIKIKDIIKNSLDNMKEGASMFMDIAKDVVMDIDGGIDDLHLFDVIDSFIITLTALEMVGMEEELFNDLMLKMYYFMREYFFGEEEEEIPKEEELTDERIDKETRE